MGEHGRHQRSDDGHPDVKPSYDDLLATLAAASAGNLSARIAVPASASPAPEHSDETKLALALNLLLDDLTVAASQRQRELAERTALAERLQLLADASREFSAATDDLPRLFESIARRLGQVVGDFCALRTMSDDQQWVEVDGASYHRDAELLAEVRALALAAGRQRLGEGLSGRVAQSGQPLLIPQVDPAVFAASAEPRFRPLVEKLAVSSVMALPLVCRGQVVGVVNLLRSGPQRPYTQNDLLLVQSIADHAALAIGNARSYAAERAARLLAETAAAELQRAARVQALAAIVDASDDAIISNSLDGTIRSWNPGAERLFGYSADEVIGKSIALLLPPEVEREHAQMLETVSRGEVARFESLRRCKDGRDIDVWVTNSPVFDDRGQVIGIAKVARDITERRRAEARLARAKDSTDAANRELEAFSYSVAHDLRAPLRGMNGFSHLLVEHYGSQLNADGRDWLQEIVGNSHKMGDLIDALLGLARVTRSGLNAERVDLSDIVRRAASRLRQTEPERAVDFQIRDNLRVFADPNLTSALVDNLVGNAWKFTAKADRPRIEFGVIDDYAPNAAGAATFFVRDNGAGFDMAYASKLFTPFARLHTTNEFPGTGIGLATVQRIVNRHGGRIWAEGAVDRGATFYFTLPQRSPARAS